MPYKYRKAAPSTTDFFPLSFWFGLLNSIFRFKSGEIHLFLENMILSDISLNIKSD